MYYCIYVKECNKQGKPQDGIGTHDLQVSRPVLYQLSYICTILVPAISHTAMASSRGRKWREKVALNLTLQGGGRLELPFPSHPPASFTSSCNFPLPIVISNNN